MEALASSFDVMLLGRRTVALEHMRLVDDADLSFPIIVSSSGTVMDGMHRVVKAVRQRLTKIDVQFYDDPEPDHVGLGPKELPYEETAREADGADGRRVG